jgi:hypothetical protein
VITGYTAEKLDKTPPTGQSQIAALDDSSQVISPDPLLPPDTAGDSEVILIEESSPLHIADVSTVPSVSPLSVDALSIAKASPTGGLENLIAESIGEFYGGSGTGTANEKASSDSGVSSTEKSKSATSESETEKMPAKPDDLPADFPAELLADKGGKKGVAKKDVKKKDKDNRPRVEVTVLRPRNEFVSSMEDVIGRTKVDGHPIVLVRSRQVGSTWWVQQVIARNGKYFRAVARFGNNKTAEGTRFQYVVAFVKNDKDIPEVGTNYTEIPAEFEVSEEFDAVIKNVQK